MPERGAMAALMMAVIALLAVVSISTASLASLFAARASAHTAADAAALAAAVATHPATGRGSPASEAAKVVAANGADLRSCVCRVDSSMRPRVAEVVAVVRVAVPLFGELDVRGAARAEFDPRRWLGR